jgi:hypothetical protein
MIKEPQPAPKYYQFDADKVLAELRGYDQRMRVIKRAVVRNSQWFEGVSDDITCCVFCIEKRDFKQADTFLRRLRSNLCEAENTIKQRYRAGRSPVRSHRGTKVSYI